MYRKILVGYDDSDQAGDALALGRQLGDAIGADLVVAGVFPWDPIWHAADSQFRDEDVRFAAKIEEAAKRVGAEAEAVPGSSPAHGLHDLAEEIGADLVLVGSAVHGRVGQIFVGTTGLSLLQGSPCAVGIAPRGYREHADRTIAAVVVGFDGSEESRLALTAASSLAADTGARLRLLSVAVPPPIGSSRGGAVNHDALVRAIEQTTRERLDEARGTVPDGIEVEATMVTGDPVSALADAGRTPGTLMVVGSRGYGPLRRVLLGSVSTHLVRSAPCPLIVTPRGMREPARPEPKTTAVENAS